MTTTPTDFQPFTTQFLATLSSRGLLQKNKEVAAMVNAELVRLGYDPKPQTYTVGGAVLPPENQCVAVTSRTVTRWKRGVLPVGVHEAGVVGALGMEAASAYSAATTQAVYTSMREYGVDLTQEAAVDISEGLLSEASQQRRWNVYVRGAAGLFSALEARLGVRFALPSSTAMQRKRVERVVEDVLAAYATKGLTPPKNLPDWIRRVAALRASGYRFWWVCGLMFRIHLYYTEEMVAFLEEENAAE